MKKTCSCGKHSAKRKTDKKKVIGCVILFIVFVFLMINILQNDESIETTSENVFENVESLSNHQTNETSNTIVPRADMPNKIGKYNIVGQLVIEKIELDKYILNKTTKDSLNLSVTKLYGPGVNEKGNFCIIGHNSKGLFIKLKKLKVDDTFYLIDKENCEKVTYQIYDKYTVIPTNLECLNQNTKDRREVTLITCNPRRVN